SVRRQRARIESAVSVSGVAMKAYRVLARLSEIPLKFAQLAKGAAAKTDAPGHWASENGRGPGSMITVRNAPGAGRKIRMADAVSTPRIAPTLRMVSVGQRAAGTAFEAAIRSVSGRFRVGACSVRLPQMGTPV